MLLYFLVTTPFNRYFGLQAAVHSTFQVTVGDCNTTRPGMMDFAGKAKWDAWNAKKGNNLIEISKSVVFFTLILDYSRIKCVSTESNDPIGDF